MSKTMCPGQDTLFWGADSVFEIACGQCGRQVEFFKDDARRKCPGCGSVVRNPKLNLGCAKWCAHARECLGFDPAEREAEASQADASLVDRLIAAMKATFGKDEKRINHAMNVLDVSRKILAGEDADPRVVLAAAVLHDIGIQEAERKHGSTAGKYQEMEGAPMAEAILKQEGLDPEAAGHVVGIVGSHHSARAMDTPEFRVIWDADHIVNIPDDYSHFEPERLHRLIEKVFKTRTGKRIAHELYG